MISKAKFFHAAEYNYLEVVKEYTMTGADINIKDKYGYTALMYASMRGCPEVAEYLIRAGAGIDIQNDYCNTALTEASDRGNLEIVKYLVEMGADTNIKNISGNTALQVALYHNYSEIMEILENSDKYILCKRLDTDNESDAVKNSSIF